MNRLSAALLVVAGVLLITWAVAPATPAPAALQAEPRVDRTAPTLLEINADVDRLRERLAAAPVYPKPTRDPFRYGGRAAERVSERAATGATSETPAAPAPAWPALLAILTDRVDGATVFRAVLMVAGDVVVVKAGEMVGEFRVGDVFADGATLVEPASERTVRLTLKSVASTRPQI